jgi:hypothetical protein
MLSWPTTAESNAVSASESPQVQRHNLPHPTTRLLGRERELAEVTTLVR